MGLLTGPGSDTHHFWSHFTDWDSVMLHHLIEKAMDILAKIEQFGVKLAVL